MSKLVDELIHAHKVMVFSKTYCPYCVKAKNVLGKYKISDINILELDDHPQADEIQTYLGKLTGARTVSRLRI